MVEVDLASGSLRSHALSDARAAKGIEGSERETSLVGPHTLAITGVDTTTAPSEAEVQRAIGLRLVDTSTWDVRLVAPSAGASTPLPESGLALYCTLA